MKLAIIIHLYYIDLWDEFSSKLKNLTQNFDLYVTLCENNEDIINKIKKDFINANIVVVENKGLDIRPFLLILNNIISSNKEYNYIIKLHTKKSLHQNPSFGQHWRNTLVNSLIGSAKQLDYIINKLENTDYKMATSSSYMYEELNIDWMMDIITALELKIPQKRNFAAGTMFIVDYSIFKEFFKNINIETLCDLMNEGYTRDGGIEHKMERIFGFIINENNYKIYGIE